jgi:tetratricopeptide (TPR) repeat protein
MCIDRKGYDGVNQMTNNSPAQNSYFSSQVRGELMQGDWDGLYQTSAEWLETEPGQPVATFIQNMACLFINPPDIIRNRHYLDTVKDKEWKSVVSWFADLQTESERHNPYFQALNFIIEPNAKKKKAHLEGALDDHPNNAEILFFEAVFLQDRNQSIEKLKLAVENKPEFPAALFLLGIFSLQLNQVEAAESYLKQAINQAPDFLEAHYQLGSLYSLYIPDAADLAKKHLEKVIELDPDGDTGRDAKKVLESNAIPQFGQRILRATGRRGRLSILTISGIALLAVWLFAYPIATTFDIQNPGVIGVMAGVIVFIGLYTANYRRR